MQTGARRASGESRASTTARCGVLLLVLATGGCVTSQQRMFASGAGSVAFESIDGPPAQVFRKLVTKLNDEAQSRRVAVVSREAPSQYRVRGYVSAQLQSKAKRNFVAWVWDVYDSEDHRAIRLSGEEPAGPARKDAWASADDKVLSRVAQSGMQQLAEFLATSGVAPAAPSPETPSAATVVGRAEGPDTMHTSRDASPGQSGEEAQIEVAAADIPVPRRRPEAPKTLTADDLLTYAANRR